MCTPIDPAQASRCIEKRCAGKLTGIAQLRRAPILTESGRAILRAAPREIAIAEEPEEIILLEPHRRIRRLVRVRDAPARIAEARAESRRFFRRSRNDEAHRDPRGRTLSLELAQLRERFPEERSADVPQPDDQYRQGQIQRRDFVGHPRTDGKLHHAGAFAAGGRSLT